MARWRVVKQIPNHNGCSFRTARLFKRLFLPALYDVSGAEFLLSRTAENLHPRNRLVAKFLGLANIISARLEKGRLFFNPDLSLETPQLNSPKVQVMVAIRPGAITLEELGGEQVWRGVVEWITFLGSFTRYVVRVQELSLAVYRPLHASDLQLKVGCEVGVRIDPAEILLLPEE